MNSLKYAAPLALILTLAACKGQNLVGSPVVVAPPPPPPPPVGTTYNVDRCLSQSVSGRSVADILIPDLVSYDPTKPPGFPNGRRFSDPVIDIELSGLFLDQTRHTPNTLVNIPFNPATFDQPLPTTFPYIANALGTPELSQTNGSNFNFRTEPTSQFVRVERVGVPAVSTINILSPRKNAYNDGSPTADAADAFRADIKAGLAQLTGLIADDLQVLGLTICATPI
jgi:hypothetical protein